MKLINARVNGNPRQVSTKYGDKSVLDVITADGQSVSIWRPVGDVEVMGRKNGERVSIAIDSKGKASLVEHASNSPAVGLVEPLKLPFEAEMQLKRQMGFQAEHHPSRSDEIKEYVEKLAKLYNHCLVSAANIEAAGELNATAVKDIATTLFLQTTRHFQI